MTFSAVRKSGAFIEREIRAGVERAQLLERQTLDVTAAISRAVDCRIVMHYCNPVR